MAYVAQRQQDEERQNLKTSFLGSAAGSTQGLGNVNPNKGTGSGFANQAQNVLNANKGTNSARSAVDRILAPATQEYGKNIDSLNKSGADYKTESSAQMADKFKPLGDIQRTVSNYQKNDTNTRNTVDSILGTSKQLSQLARPTIPQSGFRSQVQAGNFQPSLQKNSNSNYSKGMGSLDSAFVRRDNLAELSQKADTFDQGLYSANRSLDDLQSEVNSQNDQSHTNRKNQLQKSLSDELESENQTRNQIYQVEKTKLEEQKRQMKLQQQTLAAHRYKLAREERLKNLIRESDSLPQGAKRDELRNQIDYLYKTKNDGVVPNGDFYDVTGGDLTLENAMGGERGAYARQIEELLNQKRTFSETANSPLRFNTNENFENFLANFVKTGRG
jgi:hypothetical protein